MASQPLTEIQQRNQSKSEWTRRARGKGHKLTWTVRRRGARTYNGQCRNCPGTVTVYPGGGVETFRLTTFRRCPGASR